MEKNQPYSDKARLRSYLTLDCISPLLLYLGKRGEGRGRKETLKQELKSIQVAMVAAKRFTYPKRPAIILPLS